MAFFGLLFFAALTSSVSLLEVGVAAALRTTDRSRREVTAVLTGLIFLVGLPSALSYRAVDRSVVGVRVLDLLDESVGAYALPITATIIAVVFTRYQDPETLRSQIGDGFLRPLVASVIPIVLVAVTGLRLFGGVGMSWQYTGPAVEVVGRLVRAAMLVGVGVLLLTLGRVVSRRLPSRIRRRPKERPSEPGS